MLVLVIDCLENSVRVNMLARPEIVHSASTNVFLSSDQFGEEVLKIPQIKTAPFWTLLSKLVEVGGVEPSTRVGDNGLSGTVTNL